MNIKSSTLPPKLEQVFRALSDPTRLRIMNLLSEGEMCVCDLVSILGALQPAVSRHLSYLRKVGLVLARKEGLWVHYRLADPKTGFHRKLLECLTSGEEQWGQLGKDRKQLRCEGRSDCC
ncbi:MAG: metalloregulator ArsR/SmtB family transcription factor [Planctomycetales bacterium]